ncbi:leucyl-tRNA synthetase [Westerdykella ornata]|uniref:leucine--tRNA ligase n=1 Tax=Westerdykella ornata TaxID=318751 RepID=A0A6A6JF28_WESOR|nr:leucyl-tRNA synthetase [Westerdykella ornata]KAF2274236.1 leucyl-tRNA synthetase [Westerdykella ornata]
MFPYPSGTLHLGHLRVYTISDVLARFHQMQGRHVIHPIGWDAFGLPAENAALERGIHPETWTRQNISTMKKQMEAMGGRWDWDREIATCDPEFYKHTQVIFLRFFKRGLAYQAESLVNYDPVDRTVLANEQVDANGCSWRSGAKVEKKMLKQWFLKIKEFQEPLLKDLDALAKDGNWPERVVAMQRNWIGRSEGTKLRFDVTSNDQTQSIEVFTTRADTLFGVQYIALSLTHPIVQAAARQDSSLREFLAGAEHLAPDSKAGYLLRGITARNPLAKVAQGFDEEIPIYVAPYVLADYGSGAVMGVPGHDNRDHAFWRVNAPDSPVRHVVFPEKGSPVTLPAPGSVSDKPLLEKGYVADDIPGFGGLTSEEAVEAILSKPDMAAEKKENWRLRDWLISRQRYWGTPIPIIHCGSCGPVPVPAQDLPVRLPELDDAYFLGKTGNPLAEHPTWKKTTCPSCGSAAERETDTMDTFMDSSWYFFRFLSPRLESKPVDPKQAEKHMPVDVYIGGVEHAILHLLYARFISKFLATTELWPAGKKVLGEPFKRLVTQGMVHGKTYSDPATGRFLKPDEVDLSKPANPIIRATREPARVSFEKMSKSKHNGVDPGQTIATYGADVTRAHMLFQAPVGDVLEWDETKITGVERWLTRVLRLSTAFWMPVTILERFTSPNDLDAPLNKILLHLQQSDLLRIQHRDLVRIKADPTLPGAEFIHTLAHTERLLWHKTQETIASVTKSYAETISLNTIISDLMTLTNTIWDTPHTSRTVSYLQWYAVCHLLRMLAPIAPATAEEAWNVLHTTTGKKVAGSPRHPLRHFGSTVRSIFAFGFPKADLEGASRLRLKVQCVFAVNGKKKFVTGIPPVSDRMRYYKKDEITDFVLQKIGETEEGREWLEEGKGKLWKLAGETEGVVVGRSGVVLPKGWSVVVPEKGRLINVVGPEWKRSRWGDEFAD